MARVEATAEVTELDGDYGEIEGLLVTCNECGHQVEVFGTGDASARRGGVMLAQSCPRGAKNFYVVD
jgi:hypothetical protein